MWKCVQLMKHVNLPLIIDETRRLISDSGTGPVMVHTSLPGVMRLGSLSQGLARHVETIQEMSTGRALWVSAFDDQWISSKRFNVHETPSAIGVINEYYRKNISKWRTAIPLASFCGVEDEPFSEASDLPDIYGEESLFSKLVSNDGLILHYGSGFFDTTFLHHVEQCIARPLYRFDKNFSGILCDRFGVERTQSITFHCRPMDRHLNYDWTGLELELIDAGAVLKIENQLCRIVVISARKMLSYCAEKLMYDPLCLLDRNSLEWVHPMLDKLGRRFEKEDFE